MRQDKRIVELLEELVKVVKEDSFKPKDNARFKLLPDGWIYDKENGIEWGPSSEKRMNWEDAKKYAEDKGGRKDRKVDGDKISAQG